MSYFTTSDFEYQLSSNDIIPIFIPFQPAQGFWIQPRQFISLEITLKKASEKDIPVLISIEKSVGETGTYSPALTEEDWKELFEGEVYLIEKDGETVGNVSYERKSPDCVYLSGLVISPRFQGQGIGRAVMVKVLETLKWARRIELVTHPNNKAAIALYESLGFVIEARKENYFGDGEPRLVMGLEA